MADRVKALGGKIVHGPMALPPHMERVVIVEDADGFEYCFVDATGFAKVCVWEEQQGLHTADLGTNSTVWCCCCSSCCCSA